MLAILCEERIALTIYRPEAFVKGIFGELTAQHRETLEIHPNNYHSLVIFGITRRGQIALFLNVRY